MNSESVDLIATDPPFNKGRDFHATPDSLAAGAKFQDRWTWENDVHDEWAEQLQDDHPATWAVIDWSRLSYGDDMGAFLCFMAVRLLEMNRILKPTGSIYLHCDPTASHYLKALMDAIFEAKHFLNEIVWRRSAAHNSAGKFGPIHDIILFYRKPEYSHNVLFSPYSKGYVKEYFTKSDEKGIYREQQIHGSGTRNGMSGKPWRGFDPTSIGRHWAVPSELVRSAGIDPDLPQHEKLDTLYEMGFINIDSNFMPTYRQYLDDSPGVPIQDIWSYHPYTKGILKGTDDDIDAEVRWLPDRDKVERVGYPTQKPLGLYSRIIRSSTKENGMVLDPFCGCATTCVAAENLKRQWVGIDIWDKAKDTVVARLQKRGFSVGNRKDPLMAFGKIHYETELPCRTDSGDTSAPFLRVKERVKEPDGPKMTRKQMYNHLLGQKGCRCMGCDREFDDPRYLELDHNTPRADGGINHISNRVLLCGPCNRLKSNTFTLSGLRKENRKRGFMR